MLRNLNIHHLKQFFKQGAIWMARIRSIKPEFWSDVKIANLPKATALFFIALWNFADDQGIIEDDSRTLSLRIPIYRSQDVHKMLYALWKEGLIKRSPCDGLVFITGWKHQKIDRPRDGKWNVNDIKWLDYSDSTIDRDNSTIIRRKDRIGKEGKDRIGSNIAKGSSDQPSRSEIIPISCEIKELSKPAKKPKPTLSSQSIKKVYVDSFRSRYGSEPAWAAKENTLANALIANVGLENALRLAEYYPTYIDAWHVKQRHPFALLVSQYHKVLTDMQNIKHVVDARTHEKEFDEKVEEYQYRKRKEELRIKIDLSNEAFVFALKDDPNLKDYQFDYEKFIQSKGLPLNIGLNDLKKELSKIYEVSSYEKRRIQ